MPALHPRITLDDKAREYLRDIEAETTRANMQNSLKAFYAFRRWGCPTPLGWPHMNVMVLSDLGAWMTEQGYASRSKRTAYSFPRSIRVFPR